MDIADDPWLGASPFDLEFRDNPYPALKRLREIDPVNETPVGIWRLTRYRDVMRMLTQVRAGVRMTDGSFPGEAMAPAGVRADFMLQQDAPNHTRLRRLVSKAFSPKHLESLRARLEVLVGGILDHLAERGEMDVIADLALPVPSTIICEMMGVPVEDRERFTQWTADATLLLAAMIAPPELVERGLAGRAALVEYFDDLIARRRKNLTDDILSQLIRAEEDGDRLSASELQSQSVGLLIAGFETTIGLIGNGIRALIQHPDQLTRLQAEPNLIASAVEECLRFDGPIMLTPRFTHEDVEFDGKVIPKDRMVWSILFAANRDPERFPDPDRFDITRPDNHHVAFGGGAHFCLGAHLARMEAQIAIGMFVDRFRNLELESQTVEWGRSLFRVPGRLPIRFNVK